MLLIFKDMISFDTHTIKTTTKVTADILISTLYKDNNIPLPIKNDVIFINETVTEEHFKQFEIQNSTSEEKLINVRDSNTKEIQNNIQHKNIGHMVAPFYVCFCRLNVATIIG